MGIESWFLFRSKEDIRKQREAYEKKIFPFGERQKEHVKSLLKENNTSKRANLDEMVYMYVTYREYLADGEAEERYDSWLKLDMGKDLNMEDKLFIKALAELDAKLDNDERLVSAEDVRELLDSYRR